ncbi:MAG TPA: pitrilysin family protein, partial [Alphaproteobacteria bacterium]|nr:pitrilysin family protein [Alphaproteobacteria bacterium]
MTILRTAAPIAMVFAIFTVATAQTPAPASQKQTTRPAVASSWKQIPVPQLKAFHPQQPRRVELANGMVLFFQEDHELPFINGAIRIRGGSRDEPAEKAGLAALYAESWRNGGTRTKTGDELDDFLESRAARVETISSVDSEFIQWSSLKTDFDSVLPVVIDLLQAPEFRKDKVELALQQLAGAVARRNDDDGEIANRESTKLAYGSGNPYARTPELYTLSAITRDDLLAWHHRTVVPNNMILGVVGDFDSAAMERKLRDALGGLPKRQLFASAPIEYRSAAPGIYFVGKDDVNQSEIRMVHLGIDRHSPDYYAVE